ncbi:histidine phosphatase family protein [Glaciihabitans sp. INWT7]|uniref:histidine phosphatase family protein n=1 Tax=Glaciihabitans sp. INWT7 TaxID=2596912 RepID=UPI0016275ED3|nr:histidine phosphatase family protein [Glaciihabitans sp. INWT7]QNE46796.1 histidine phosphatase family protein [Glaciihabitans sp. INWT7]
MTLIYLVRHGETDWNRARRIQGSTDIPLNDTGRAQAARSGHLLARRTWDGIASSPLSRAFETGAIIAREVGIAAEEIEVLEDLVERRYGEAEGLDDRELVQLFPGDSPVPGRERREDVAARVIPALVALAERHERDRPEGSPDARLIVTTHGGVIRTVLNHVSPQAKYHRGIPITNGSVHSFRHVNGTIELVLFNDPIDVESIADDCVDFDEQNAVEYRELGSEPRVQ